MQMQKKSKLELFLVMFKLFSGLFQKIYTKSYDYGYNRQIKKNRAKAVMAVKDIPLFGICENCDNNPNMDLFNPSICLKCTEYKTMMVLQEKLKYHNEPIINLQKVNIIKKVRRKEILL